METSLESVEAIARAEFDAKFAARERGLTVSRTLIRRSANAIRAFHRGELDKAQDLMEEGAVLLREAVEGLEAHPDVLFAGFVADAAKEYAEARLTYALGLDLPLPSPDDLGVWVGSYLHGLGEAVGELRRRLLDLLRSEELERAEATLASMDDVVDLLASLDYPDGMTRGLRRTTDVARALVERSRSDLTTTIVQERLRRDLSEHYRS
jgi:translin